MCEVCGQYFCYPSCPSYEGESAELGSPLFRCVKCGMRLFRSDNYTIYNGRFFCEECLKRVNGDGR